VGGKWLKLSRAALYPATSLGNAGMD
jgi:hypothetical protein